MADNDNLLEQLGNMISSDIDPPEKSLTSSSNEENEPSLLDEKSETEFNQSSENEETMDEKIDETILQDPEFKKLLTTSMEKDKISLFTNLKMAVLENFVKFRNNLNFNFKLSESPGNFVSFFKRNDRILRNSNYMNLFNFIIIIWNLVNVSKYVNRKLYTKNNNLNYVLLILSILSYLKCNEIISKKSYLMSIAFNTMFNYYTNITKKYLVIMKY